MFNGHASSLGNTQSYNKQLSIRSSCSISWDLVSGAVYTGVEVHRMDLEMSGLVE